MISFSLFSCKEKDKNIEKAQTPIETQNDFDSIFLGKVVVILATELDGNSKNINIQDYIENGKSFIPIFSTLEKFNESTKGMVKNPKIEVDGIFLLSILNENETLKLNPGLDDEKIFHSSDLIKKYSGKIAELKIEMQKLQKE